MGQGERRRRLYTISIPVRNPEEEKVVLLWSEFIRFANKEKGRAILELIQREVEKLKEDDPSFYNALSILVEKRLEEDHGAETGDD